jgi:hypothetical protein
MFSCPNTAPRGGELNGAAPGDEAELARRIEGWWLLLLETRG